MPGDWIEWEEYVKGCWIKREATEPATYEHVRTLMRALSQGTDLVTWPECINGKRIIREGRVAVVRDLIQRLNVALASHSEHLQVVEGPVDRLTLSVE